MFLLTTCCNLPNVDPESIIYLEEFEVQVMLDTTIVVQCKTQSASWLKLFGVRACVSAGVLPLLSHS